MRKSSLIDHTGDAFEEVFDCGSDFGSQGIIGFGTAWQSIPVWYQMGPLRWWVRQNRKLVLVGATSAHIIDLAKDGLFN